jgi:galactitol-specific phosphotransferase system IIB component
MGKAITKNSTKDEKRVITFRDDNYSIDSKSRFKDIVSEVPFEPMAFYNAIKDAIQKAFDKKDVGITMEQAEKSQAKELQEKTDLNVQIAQEDLTPTKMSSEIIDFYKSAEATDKTMIANKIKEFGLSKLSDLSTLDFEAIKSVYDLIK